MDGSAAGDLAVGQRLIFVGGAPRSGTTLVQNMLDSHPDVLGGPEFLHLEAIVRLRNQLLDSNRKNWTTDFYSGDAVDGMISDLIAKLLLPLADRHDAPYLSEKTPTNVLVARELLDLFPESRFIHVVRDPRGIVASMLKAGERAAERGVRVQSFTRSTRDAVNYIQRCYRAGFAAADHAPGRCLEVRFEALVADPAAETARVCDFLGLPWDAKIPARRRRTTSARPGSLRRATTSGTTAPPSAATRTPRSPTNGRATFRGCRRR